MSHRELRPGEQRFRVLGTTVVVDFNDRTLLGDLLDLYSEFEGIKEPVDGDPDKARYDTARLTVELIGRADELVTRAVGQAARDKMFGKGRTPMREPIAAVYALVGPAGKAYDEMFQDYAPQDS